MTAAASSTEVYELTDESPAPQPPASPAPPERKAGELVAVVAHDLLEPLSTVTGFLHLLEGQHGAGLAPEGRDLLAWALRGTAEMAERIKALLDQARLGAVEPAVEPVELTEAVARAGAALSGSINRTGALIEVVEGSDHIPADPVLLDRVLLQLLSNAVKFHRPGRRPRVKVEAIDRGPSTDLVVSDNGVGVDASQRERVFDLFARADPDRPGFGVGLAQCRSVAELHGGGIRIEDSAMGGTTVVMTFPARTR
jgi:signal transduction histidine kinase